MEGSPLEAIEKARRLILGIAFGTTVLLAVASVIALDSVGVRAENSLLRDEVKRMEKRRQDEGWVLDLLLELVSTETALVEPNEDGWNPRMLELIERLPDLSEPEAQGQYPCAMRVIETLLAQRVDDNFTLTPAGRRRVIKTIRGCRDGTVR